MLFYSQITKSFRYISFIQETAEMKNQSEAYSRKKR